MTRVLVAGWVGSTNLGDELVFAGLVRKLAARGITVTAVSSDAAATRSEHGVDAISQGDLRGLVDATGAADAVVFGGGGLVQDETSPLNLPFHLSRLSVARSCDTPFAAVGLGVDGLRTRLGRRLVRHGLRDMVACSVRDQRSADILSQLGVANPRVAADLAVGLPAPGVASARAAAGGQTAHGKEAVAEGRLVVSLRPWAGRRGLLPASLRARRGDPTGEPLIAALAAGIDEAADRTGLPVRFVALQADRDDPFHRRVAAYLRTEASFATPRLADLAAEFAPARAVVAMRYHAGILATLAGVPSVLIGYAPKVEALAGDLGAGARLLSWDPETLRSLPDALDAVADHGPAVVDARDRLRYRDAGNDAALDALLDEALGPVNRLRRS